MRTLNWTNLIWIIYTVNFNIQFQSEVILDIICLMCIITQCAQYTFFIVVCTFQFISIFMILKYCSTFPVVKIVAVWSHHQMTDCVLVTVLVVLLSLMTSPSSLHSQQTQLSLDISARSPCPDIVPVTAVANTGWWPQLSLHSSSLMYSAGTRAQLSGLTECRRLASD